jgi:hypothetical protein
MSNFTEWSTETPEAERLAEGVKKLITSGLNQFLDKYKE